MATVDFDGITGFESRHGIPIQKEFDWVHDRLDIISKQVELLYPPIQGLDLILYVLCFISGVMFGVVMS